MADYPEGIDCSNNNGAILWPQVAAGGIRFGIAKASEGVGFVDRFFTGNMLGMANNGLARGAYHFGLPSQNGAVAEAEHFVATLLGQLGDLAPGDVVALDLEDPAAGGDLSAWTLQWLRHTEQLVGFKPLVYTSPGYAQAHGLATLPEIGQHGLWLASWGVSTPPPAPAPWDLVAIHQYGVGAAGSVPGVAGEIDRNRFNGTIEQFRKYGKPGADIPMPPPPADPRDEQIASLKRDLDDARSKLGVASVDYVKGLRDLADSLEALKP
jgi:lysozyme